MRSPEWGNDKMDEILKKLLDTQPPNPDAQGQPYSRPRKWTTVGTLSRSSCSSFPSLGTLRKRGAPRANP